MKKWVISIGVPLLVALLVVWALAGLAIEEAAYM